MGPEKKGLNGWDSGEGDRNEDATRKDKGEQEGEGKE